MEALIRACPHAVNRTLLILITVTARWRSIHLYLCGVSMCGRIIKNARSMFVLLYCVSPSLCLDAVFTVHWQITHVVPPAGLPTARRTRDCLLFVFRGYCVFFDTISFSAVSSRSLLICPALQSLGWLPPFHLHFQEDPKASKGHTPYLIRPWPCYCALALAALFICGSACSLHRYSQLGQIPNAPMQC